MHSTDFFINMGPDLDKNNKNIPRKYRELIQEYTSSMYIYPKNVNEISDIVSYLKSNKSAGYDEISPKVIKSVIPYISKPLCEICNISLNTDKFPDKLKISVSPVY